MNISIEEKPDDYLLTFEQALEYPHGTIFKVISGAECAYAIRCLASKSPRFLLSIGENYNGPVLYSEDYYKNKMFKILPLGSKLILEQT